MKEETPKDITPIKRKGIEMAVKGLSKTYPFVIGYKDDDSDQYESAHYIDLLIDLDGLANYMGVEVNPYWSNELSNNPSYQKVYAIWSYLKFPDEIQYDYNTDVSKHPGYILGQDITQLLGTIYEYLPEQYVLHYKSTTGYFPDNPPIYPVSLKINGYIMK
jgi:hypothetical protein